MNKEERERERAAEGGNWNIRLCWRSNLIEINSLLIR